MNYEVLASSFARYRKRTTRHHILQANTECGTLSAHF